MPSLRPLIARIRGTRYQLPALAAVAGVTATGLFLLSGTLPSSCHVWDCGPTTTFFSNVLTHLGFMALFVGLGAGGAWIGAMGHQTWSDRLHLESMALSPKNEAEKRAVKRLEAIAAGDHPADSILERARSHLWTGGTLAVASLLLWPPSASAFLDPHGTIGYLLPMVTLLLVFAAASTVRGIVLLRSGRRVLHKFQSEAGVEVVPSKQKRSADAKASKAKVETGGFEPPASALRRQRSSN